MGTDIPPCKPAHRALCARGLSISQRPAVFCLLALCQKTQQDRRAAHGDDPRVVSLLRGTTPTPSAMGYAPRACAELNQSPHNVANLALGLPVVGRHSPGSPDAARSGARAHCRPP